MVETVVNPYGCYYMITLVVKITLKITVYNINCDL